MNRRIDFRLPESRFPFKAIQFFTGYEWPLLCLLLRIIYSVRLLLTLIRYQSPTTFWLRMKNATLMYIMTLFGWHHYVGLY